MEKYRSLTVKEIEQLERQGCLAEDWTSVGVAEDFDCRFVRNVRFYGDIRLGLFDGNVELEEGFSRHSGVYNATLQDVVVGDDSLIENIGCHICRYVIGEGCYIANVGTMATTEGATFGQNVRVPVLNEAGEGNVCMYEGLTSQMASLMVWCYDHDKEATRLLMQMISDYADKQRPERGLIGYGVKIVNTREIVNTIVCDDCEIVGASRLSDCTIVSSDDASTFVGTDVVCDNVIIQAGASVVDGARLDNCFVGEACHVGKGFSAESSLFFANSYMDNGEACAAFCGPFSVSHHKSTLLIGGGFSFYNAGSATNFSNHAYKMGPVHSGILERGSKTASGSHVLWPAHIGAFSVCLGKIQSHPDTSCLPFSYVIGRSDGTTSIVPGRNLITVGTFRDVGKWARRDLRPRSGRRSIVNFDWLNPKVVDEVIEGKLLLERLQAEQGENAETYEYAGVVIKRKWLIRGIELYDLAVRMAIVEALKNRCSEQSESRVNTEEWLDFSGLLAPVSEIDDLCYDIKEGVLEDIHQVEDRLIAIHGHYDQYKWKWLKSWLNDRLGGGNLTEDNLDAFVAEGEKAGEEWVEAIRRDAQKEYALGDVDEAVLREFLDGCHC